MTKNVKYSTRIIVERLLLSVDHFHKDQGEIAEIAGVSSSVVSSVQRKLVADGYMPIIWQRQVKGGNRKDKYATFTPDPVPLPYYHNKPTATITCGAPLTSEQICDIRNALIDDEPVDDIVAAFEVPRDSVMYQKNKVKLEFESGTISRRTQYYVEGGVIKKRTLPSQRDDKLKQTIQIVQAVAVAERSVVPSATTLPQAVAVATPTGIPDSTDQAIANYAAARKAQLMQQLPSDAQLLAEILAEQHSK